MATALAALALGYVAVARAALGDVEGARRAIVEGRAAMAGNEAALELLDVHLAHCDLAAGAPGAVERARAALARLGERPLGQHRRLAAELLRRVVERIAPPAGALVFQKTRLRVPDGAWLDSRTAPCRRRSGQAPRRTASRRAGHRGPGFGAGRRRLAGEKLIASAGQNRLRVLVSGLRSSGLKEVLKSAEGGYFLDPKVPVVSD